MFRLFLRVEQQFSFVAVFVIAVIELADVVAVAVVFVCTLTSYMHQTGVSFPTFFALTKSLASKFVFNDSRDTTLCVVSSMN